MGVKLTQTMKVCQYNCDEKYLYLLSCFRMALNKTLNATCDLDGYLVCRMPAEALEVEIKVKTK